MRDGQKQEACSMLLEFGKRKSADHSTLCERMVFRKLGRLQKNGAAEKECECEEDLRGR